MLVGTALAKSRLSRYQGHVVGALIGAAFVLNAVAASISTLPSIEGRLHALNLSVSRWVEDVFVIGAHSTESSIFLIVLGALMWGAGQFGAYAVFRRHRPLPAVVLLGFMLLVNVSITINDQYLHVIVFMAASLVLLIVDRDAHVDEELKPRRTTAGRVATEHGVGSELAGAPHQRPDHDEEDGALGGV